MNDERSQRTAVITGPIDLGRSRGLEIGPLDQPLVRKSDGEVLYVDYADTETLRRHPYDDSINPKDIVGVDVVWSDRPLAECVSGRFDYIVASHVIEHVPDVVGWLLDLHSVLKPGATVGLAIPDRRFTFDYARHESTVGEMVEAYFYRYRRPSIRQMFDSCYLSVNNDVGAAWASVQDPSIMEKFNPNPLALAYGQAIETFNSRTYFDSHCWVFTPRGWLSNIEALANIGLFPFIISFMHATKRHSFEFIMRLQACDRNAKTEINRSIAAAKSVIDGSPGEILYNSLAHSAEAKLNAIQQSTTWRLTAPLRQLSAKIRQK